MIEFFQMIVSGTAVGSSYALMAVALVIIYKTSEIINFAQGGMSLITAYLTFMTLETYGFSFPMAFLFAFVFALLLGIFLEFTVIRRAENPTALGFIIITLGLEFVLSGFVSWKFGADQQTIPFPITPYDSLDLGGAYFSHLELTTLAAAIVILIILFLFYRYSKLGLAMKATQQNLMAARIMGIRTNRIMMLTWGISSLVGAVAALLIAPMVMEPYMMWDPLMKGFAAAVLGGMTSLPGAVFGAYILGIIEQLFGGYVSIEFKSVVSFAIIVLVLCLKPSGLFARHYVKKV
jgi:branched-chain amino acid transport system permease protein